MPAISACRSESSPSVAETCVESTCTNSTGQSAGLEHEGEVLRLLDRVEAADLRAAAGDAVGEARIGEVDDRERADLAVEHDGEALREGAGVVAAAGDAVLGREERASLGQLAGDVVELVAAVVREVEQRRSARRSACRSPGASRPRSGPRPSARGIGFSSSFGWYS